MHNNNNYTFPLIIISLLIDPVALIHGKYVYFLITAVRIRVRVRVRVCVEGEAEVEVEVEERSR